MLLVTKLPPLTYKLFDIFTSEDDFSKEMGNGGLINFGAFSIFCKFWFIEGGGGLHGHLHASVMYKL